MIRLLHGDCLEVMRGLDADSVDACVTDPPYGIGFMGKSWDRGDVAFQVETWAEVYRVLKPGGFLAAFGGTRTYHRMVCAIEDAALIIHPMLGWLFGTGFPKAKRVEAEGWEGWRYGLQSLKPALEPICLAQKKFSEKTGTANVIRWNTGAINVEGCRIPSTIGHRPNGDDGWARDESLCYSCAVGVESLPKQEVPATKAFTATRSVERSLNAKAQASLVDIVKQDTGCCDGMTVTDIATNSSTEGSGSLPTDQSLMDTKSTISTETRETTGSQICSSCGNPIICASTDNSTSRDRNASRQVQRPNGNAEPGRGSTLNGSRKRGSEASPRTGEPEHPLARYPANLCHDGSREVLEAFARFGERTSGAPTKDRGAGGIWSPSNGTPCGPQYGDTGTAARFFFSAKASREEREIGLNGFEEREGALINTCGGIKLSGAGNPRSETRANDHPTVKPLALMQWLCRLITPPGGTVLDPFAGSGSTLIAADREQFEAIGIEQSAEYLKIAHARIFGDAPLLAQIA